MVNTEYIYGVKSCEFADLTYVNALKFKLDKARALIYSLMEEDYRTRDEERVSAVFNAISFNTKLLKELG